LLEEETNFLKSVIVTRLVVEAGVAAMKVPLVLALCAMLFFGRVDLALIVSASKVPRLLKTVFQYDAAILHNLFNGVDAVHLQTDLSSRKGEERLSIWLTFASLVAAGTANMPAAYNINRRIVWNGAVASKEGKVQFTIVKQILVYLGIYLKLASFTSDGGKDALGTGTGFLGWLNRDRLRLKLELVLHVDCDLHVLNRGLVVACTHVFGKPVMNRASVLQLLYLVSTVCRENWTLVSRLLQEACNELKLDLVVGIGDILLFQSRFLR
jgi:hypothetical protein